MTRTLIALFGATAIAVLGATPQQAPTFRSSVEAVVVNASVRDGHGPVAGLTKSDFEILDNGVEQDIADITYETAPVDVTVLLDVSLSVNGPQLDRLRAATKKLMGALRTGDRAKLTSFNMRITTNAAFTNDPAVIDNALSHLAGGGATSIRDALAVELTTTAHSDRRQLIVLFSDGHDTASFTDPGSVLNLAQHSEAALDVVLSNTRGAFNVVFSNARGAFDMPVLITVPEISGFLQQLSEQTGGVYTPLESNGALDDAFKKAFDAFHSSYVLRFMPRDVAKAGVHTLTVRVTKAGHFEVHARKSYIGDAPDGVAKQ